MVFEAERDRTRWEGLAVCSWFVMIDILLLLWFIRRPVDLLKFVILVLILLSIPPLLHLAYRTWSAFTLEYWVDRNAVTIYWAGVRQIIPISSIRRVIEGQVQDLGKSTWRHWPAPHMRPGRTLGLLNLTLYATRPLTKCLLLDTDEAVFAISPREPKAFLAILQERYKLGPTQDVETEQVHPFWWSRLAQADFAGSILLVAGVLGVLTLFGIVMMRFPDLPGNIAFSYHNDGSPNVVRDKSALFLLPIVGLATWLVNGLWGAWMVSRDQQVGAYLLWGGAVVVHIFAFLALVQIIG